MGAALAMRTATAHPGQVAAVAGFHPGFLVTDAIYPGTIHGFTMSDTDAFDPSALQRHRDRLLPLLDGTLANR